MEKYQSEAVVGEKDTCKCPLCGGILGKVSKIPFYERWRDEYASVCVRHNMPIGEPNFGELFYGSPLQSKPWEVIRWELLHPRPNTFQDKYILILEKRVQELEAALTEKGDWPSKVAEVSVRSTGTSFKEAQVNQIIE